jgi:hypothetical protein
MELLLVVFIVLLTAGVAVPMFIRSYEGAKLRSSARTVLMGHRYARSVAVLQQKHVSILYDTEAGKLEIVSLQEEGAEGLHELPFEIRGAGFSGLLSSEQEMEEPTYNVMPELTRRLEEGVTIRNFEMEKRAQEDDGIYWVNYQPSGMCDSYTITLEDANGKSATVEVDPLSGSANIEYD